MKLSARLKFYCTTYAFEEGGWRRSPFCCVSFKLNIRNNSRMSITLAMVLLTHSTNESSLRVELAQLTCDFMRTLESLPEPDPRMAIDSDDDLSITSATPIQQCIFWSLALAFMFKLISFVLVAVIIHYNEWLRISGSNLDYVFIRGISYKDCAYAVDNTNQIECVKWLQGNKSEWTQFWDKHGVDVENVQLPSIWYANVYYICFLLLALYLVDMGAMLIMCCRQRQSSDDIVYQRQLTLLATFFIGVTYILVFIAVIYCRSDPFVKLQFPIDSSLGFGSKLFGFTMIFYFIAVGIQHAYRFQNFRPWLQHTSNQMRSTWRREPNETLNGRLEREVEMEQLKRT